MTRHLSSTVVLLLAVTSQLFAADSTEPERFYKELKESNDPVLQGVADEWYSLIKMQVWSDGTKTIRAKFINHDTDAKCVELQTGRFVDNKLVRESIEIQVEKLDDAGRERLKRIDQLERLIAKRLEKPAKATKEVREVVTGKQAAIEEFGFQKSRCPQRLLNSEHNIPMRSSSKRIPKSVNLIT